MKIVKTKFSELSESEISQLAKLTIKDSSFRRYLYDYVDSQDPDLDKVIYLAKGDDIVGWTLVGIDEEFGFGEEGMVHLFVDSQMRGDGLGFKLFENAIDEIKSAGINSILTYAHDEKSTAFFNSKKVQDLCQSKNIKIEVIS